MKDVLDFDLVVVGGGSGGLAAAFRATEHGARVALLEPGELGGTCVNVGCVPKKAMWLAAHLAERIELAQRLGFAVESQPPDWCELIAERQRYIANIHASYRQRLDAAGIVALPQHGRLVGARTVRSGDGVCLRAPHILIATGARPRRPQVEGAEHGLVSDDFFRFIAAPGRVAVVGGGYIGVELSGMLQALGSRVELFVRGAQLLDGFDAELAGHLQENYRQAGVAMHFRYGLDAVERDGEHVRLRDRNGDASDAFDALIFATGRQPNSEELGLADVGVDTDAGGHIVVDAKQDTSAEGVHAVGDVTDRIELTPVAIAAARRLMDRLFGGQPDARLDYDNVPTVVFAHPPLGKVGLTEDEARMRFGDGEVQVYRSSFRPMLHALADVPMRSTFKLVCVGDERRVVGLHLLGDGAEEILQGFAVALKRGITLADLRDTVAIHPTSAEEVVLMR